MRKLLMIVLLSTASLGSKPFGCFCCEDWQILPGQWRHDDWEGIQWPATHQGMAHSGLGYNSCFVSHTGYGLF